VCVCVSVCVCEALLEVADTEGTHNIVRAWVWRMSVWCVRVYRRMYVCMDGWMDGCITYFVFNGSARGCLRRGHSYPQALRAQHLSRWLPCVLCVCCSSATSASSSTSPRRHVSPHTRTHTHTHTHTHTLSLSYTHTHTHTHTHARTHTRTHTHTHKHTLVHTHTALSEWISRHCNRPHVHTHTHARTRAHTQR
jgi:hypothetical protein